VPQKNLNEINDLAYPTRRKLSGFTDAYRWTQKKPIEINSLASR